MDSPLKWVYEKGIGAHGSLARPIPSGHALPPIQLFIEVTDACNLRCRMCFYQGKLRPIERPEPPADGLLTADEILEIARALPTARLVSLSGGEPFARADFPEILARLCRIRKVHLETNATLVTVEDVRALAALGARSVFGNGLVSLDVSIYGDPETHDSLTGLTGSYRATIETARCLVGARRAAGRPFPKVNLKTTILRENLSSFPAAAAAGREIGADFVIFKIEDPGKVAFDLDGAPSPLSRTIPRPLGLDEVRALEASLDELLRAARSNGARPAVFFIPFGLPPDEIRRHYSGEADLSRYSCRHPWSRIGVMPRGDIYVCKVFGSGNVRRGSIAEMWNSAPVRAFRRRLRDRGPAPECIGCCFLEWKGASR